MQVLTGYTDFNSCTGSVATKNLQTTLYYRTKINLPYKKPIYSAMKKPSKPTQNFILLPATKTRIAPEDSPAVAQFLAQLSKTTNQATTLKLSVLKSPAEPEEAIAVKVLDSIHSEGAKLISINKEELANFRFSYPGLRIIPEKFYRPAILTQEKIQLQIRQIRAKVVTSFAVTDPDGNGIEGITIVAFTDFTTGKGASGVTNSAGVLKLKLDKNTAERIYMYAEDTYWGYFRKSVKLTSQIKVKLTPIDPGYTDALRYFYDTANWPPIKQKIRVGIIDTGVGPHTDLKVTGGKNLVKGEDENDYGDNGEGHGTHVGGIIAASGKIHGVAAGVELMSYRVFPKGAGASSFDIMKAIDQAITDQCDIINMSLGQAEDDEGIDSYIKEAYQAGIICFAANGNDERSPVSFPAAYSLSIAVSAMGRKSTFPANSVQSPAIQSPYGTDKKDFIADFSNIGPDTDLTAPGVGIISTYPNDRYAIMDGTSMACPAAAGMAARILSGNPELLNLPRNQARADEMIKYLAIHVRAMGFGANFEGKGMLFDQP